uniref:Uncharacterized protein n=1 Tax=Cucumis melo TaxID=3656 RepID=A0A9I9EFZ4_CUCME
MGIKVERLALRRNWKESCHHVLVDDAGRIRTGCKVLPKLVETALRVEQSITEEKSAVELSRGTSTASGFRGREQRRFMPGINISSRQDFKNRSGGQASRNVSYGSVFRRQSQRIPSQPIRSTVRSQPGQESIASTVRRIPCTSCGRNHRGQCLVGSGVPVRTARTFQERLSV